MFSAKWPESLHFGYPIFCNSDTRRSHPPSPVKRPVPMAGFGPWHRFTNSVFSAFRCHFPESLAAPKGTLYNFQIGQNPLMHDGVEFNWARSWVGQHGVKPAFGRGTPPCIGPGVGNSRPLMLSRNFRVKTAKSSQNCNETIRLPKN